MQLMDWTLLDALQAGALFALTASYGGDALARRDRMMGWMAFACLFLGLRHGMLALDMGPVLTPDLLDRAQGLLVAIGFLGFCQAVVQLFPHQMPSRFMAWVTLGMTPAVLRSLALPGTHPLASAFLWAEDFTYLVACAFLLRATLKARLTGDPMGGRLLLGMIGAALPVVVEIAAESFFNLQVHLSGLSLLLISMAIGTSWQWLATQSLRERIDEAESVAESWRELVPGGTFRTDRTSPFMDTTFGPAWVDRIRYGGAERLVARDGVGYRVQASPLPRGHRMGCVVREEDTRPGLGGFLSGWTVAIGVDDPAEGGRVEGWLRAWGADLEVWSTVPPREGPYPSILIWAREPSILAVWREDDLLRRRPRWIQIGGPQTEGPHTRLDPPVTEAALRAALEDLLGPFQEH